MQIMELSPLLQDPRVVAIMAGPEEVRHLALAKLIGREMCGFTEEDEKYVDMFWEPAFNKSWLYVTKDMVHKQFGHEPGKNMMSHFYAKLAKNYEESVEYKQVGDDHLLAQAHSRECGSGNALIPAEDSCSREFGSKTILAPTKGKSHGGSNKKHYIISGETYKALLQSSNTKDGKRTRKYFIKVESLCVETSKLLSLFADEQMKEVLAVAEREKEQLRAESKEMKDTFCRLQTVNQELLSYKKMSERNETIYITSTELYARQGLFKVGRTKNAKTRAISHNTAHPTGDKMLMLATFQVNNSTLAEKCLHDGLKGLRPSMDSEFFMCPYHLLEGIIDEFVENNCRFNDSVNRLIDAVYQLKLKVFDELDWIKGLDMSAFVAQTESVQVPTNCLALVERGTVKETISYDDLTDDQRREIVSRCIMAFRSQRESVLLQQAQPVPDVFALSWKAFQATLLQHLMKEYGISKRQFKAMAWRASVKEVVKGSQTLAVTWYEKSN